MSRSLGWYASRLSRMSPGESAGRSATRCDRSGGPGGRCIWARSRPSPHYSLPEFP